MRGSIVLLPSLLSPFLPAFDLSAYWVTVVHTPIATCTKHHQSGFFLQLRLTSFNLQSIVGLSLCLGLWKALNETQGEESCVCLCVWSWEPTRNNGPLASLSLSPLSALRLLQSVPSFFIQWLWDGACVKVLVFNGLSLLLQGGRHHTSLWCPTSSFSFFFGLLFLFFSITSFF